MAKIAFLLSAAVCLTLDNFVLGAIPEKRQSCESENLPANCRPLLTTTITTAAFANVTSFINTYCGGDCAQPLYSYFRDCDVPDSKNATTFDFFCSSNAAGNRCLPQVLEGQVSIASSCQDPIQETTCNVTCKTSLAAAYDVQGCCLMP